MAHISTRPDSEPAYHSSAAFGAAHVFHGFFGRRGGVSEGLYESLNCGIGSRDDPGHVMANRAIVAAAAGTAAQNILTLYQVHGTQCLSVHEGWGLDARPQADAMVTDVPGLGLGILTADCVPVLFYGQNRQGRPVIGAAHAGWKGALAGVIEATLHMMTHDYDAAVAGISAAIGPCIAQPSYEVDAAFQARFVGKDAESAAFFTAGGKAGHAQFDLPGYCALRLQRAGIRQVVRQDCDTYTKEAAYFSYRRATHRREADYGRQISVVMVRK